MIKNFLFFIALCIFSISDSSLFTGYFTVELATTHLAVLAVHVEENGMNRSVQLMVLLTFLLATLVARTCSETPSVFIAVIIITN